MIVLQLYSLLKRLEGALTNPGAAKVELEILELSAPAIEAEYPFVTPLINELIAKLEAIVNPVPAPARVS